MSSFRFSRFWLGEVRRCASRCNSQDVPWRRRDVGGEAVRAQPVAQPVQPPFRFYDSGFGVKVLGFGV
jgi:hypothetical protein